MPERHQRKLRHFRVQPHVFEQTVNFIRNAGHPPKGMTLGNVSDLINELMQSRGVMEPREIQRELRASIIDNPPPHESMDEYAARVLRQHKSKADSDERTPAESNDEIPPPNDWDNPPSTIVDVDDGIPPSTLRGVYGDPDLEEIVEDAHTRGIDPDPPKLATDNQEST